MKFLKTKGIFLYQKVNIHIKIYVLRYAYKDLSDIYIIILLINDK